MAGLTVPILFQRKTIPLKKMLRRDEGASELSTKRRMDSEAQDDSRVRKRGRYDATKEGGIMEKEEVDAEIDRDGIDGD
ncbi:MAG: hypothetical protein M1816_002003 [Peltula sp. TS41687]|nr:MAG: hypothetical protein M1816_002003 [Peltula sp. TS41687]